MDGLTPPTVVKERAIKLGVRRDTYRAEARKASGELERAVSFLEIADEVSKALESLGHELFERTIEVLESKLSMALQEVLGQPLKLKAERGTKWGALSIEFYVERDGDVEHILKGQGGSVANVLSVGLRMFALTSLDPEQHMRFLVLDEQDCWLRPDLVPRLVKIVQLAGKELGFQTLMISHHDHTVFEQFADRIYSFQPSPDGTTATLTKAAPDEDFEG